MPIGVFVPGMTKTLHLYEAHFVALVEEVLASPQRLMATAVLEPYMGTPRPASQPTQPQQGEGVGAPGSDAGGTMSLAIQWMTSQASQGVGGQGVALDGFLGVLGDELGGASSSGRGRGSADDASWLPLGAYVGGSNYLLSCGCLVKVLDAKPYVGGYLVRIRGEARLGIQGLSQMEPYLRAQVYPIADDPPSTSQWAAGAPAAQRLAALDDVMRDVQNLAAKFRCDETAAIQQAMRWVYATPVVPMVTALPAPPDASAPPPPHAAGEQQAGHAGAVQDVVDEDAESAEDALQRAARLSFAALQWVPQSSQAEKVQVLRARLLAMETRDIARRVDIAVAAMGPARSSLAAKCAIATM